MLGALSRVVTSVVAGVEINTARSLIYSLGSGLRPSPEILNSVPTFEWGSGDGSLLASSAQSSPFKPTNLIKIPQTDHQRLLEHHTTLALVRDVTGLSCPWHGVWKWGRAVVSFFQSDQVMSCGADACAQLLEFSVGRSCQACTQVHPGSAWFAGQA